MIRARHMLKASCLSVPCHRWSEGRRTEPLPCSQRALYVACMPCRVVVTVTVVLTACRAPPHRNGKQRGLEQPRLLGRPAPLQLMDRPPGKPPGAFIAGFVPAKDVVRLPFFPPPTVPAGFVAQHRFPPPPPPRPASGVRNVCKWKIGSQQPLSCMLHLSVTGSQVSRRFCLLSGLYPRNSI